MSRLILLLFIMGYSTAVDILPLGTLSDVNAAIAAADNNSVITLAAGVWTGCDYPVTFGSKYITISGMPGASIDCSGQGKAFTSASGCVGAAVQYLSIINATSAIVVSHGCEIRLINVNLTNCRDYSMLVSHSSLTVVGSLILNSSGGIHAIGSVIRVTSTLITGCFAGGGGGIRLTTSNATLHNVTGLNNTASREGGFLAAYTSNVDVFDCLFVGNHAYYGGAISVVFRSNLMVKNTNLSLNRADMQGGAVYCYEHVNATLTLVTMESNDAMYGGSVYVSGHSDVKVLSTSFYGNNGSFGGAISVQGSVLSAVNCVGENNSATLFGGFVQLAAYSNVTMTSCSLVSNWADNGGIVSSQESTFVGDQIQASFNGAINSGGSVHADGSNVRLISCNIANGTARDGGAVMADRFSNVELTNSSVFNCTATDGGALAAYASTVKLSYLVIQNCSANRGGAIIASYASTITVESCRLSNNNAAVQGGSIALYMATASVSSTLIERSTALSGGGVFVESRSIFGAFNTTALSNHADDGGFIYGCLHSNVTLDGCRLVGNSARQGGSIALCMASLIAVNVTAIGSTATIGGVAVVYEQCSVSLDMCHFSNSFARDGSVVYIKTVSTLSASRSTFINNTAANLAGVFYIEDYAVVHVEQCEFRANLAVDGGVVCVKPTSTFSATDSVGYSNKAALNGGFISSSQAKVVLRNTTLVNSSALAGGALFTDESSDVSLIGCTIANSSATTAGAILTARYTYLSIDGCTLADNSSIDKGGCLTLFTAIANITSSVFVNCRSILGGGIYMDSSSNLTAFNTTGTSNSASCGGFLFCFDHAIANLTSCNLNRNLAQRGAAVYVELGSVLTALDTTAIFNNASIAGSVVFCSDALVEVNRCNYIENVNSVVHLTSKALLNAVNTSFTNNTAYSGAAVNLIDYSNATLTGCTLVNNSAVLGGSISVNSSFMTASDTIIAFSSAGLGGGIYNTNSSESHLYGVYIARNDGYGVYNDATLIADVSTRICRNIPGHVQGIITGNATLCAQITSVIPINHIWYPGMSMTVDGADMLVSANDSIAIANNVYINSTTVPFTFVISESKDVYTGPVYVISALGRRSESFDDYVFMPHNYSHCSAKLSGGLEPPLTFVNISADIRFHLSLQCDRNVSFVQCAFSSQDAVQAMSLGSDYYQCKSPALTHQTVVPLIITIHYPGWEVAVGCSFEYIEMPTSLTVYPIMAHNATDDRPSTNLTVCGLVLDALAKPQCLFENVYPVLATVVNTSCVSCPYYSSDICTLNANNTVRVSVYGNQYVVQELVIQHVCRPSWQKDSKLDPGYVISPQTLVSIRSFNIHISSLLSCKFDEIVCDAVPSGIGVLCAAPAMPIYSKVMVYISNNRYDWIATTYIYYGDTKHTCDVNTEFDSDECSSCKVDHYKPKRSYHKCEPCLVGGYCSGSADPVALDGFYATGHDAVDRVFISCLPEKACVNQSCAEGYAGDRCAQCSPGYHRRQLDCVECSGSYPWAPFVAFCCVLLVVITYLCLEAFNGPSSSLVLAAVSIGLSFLQVFALVGSVPSTAGDGIVEPFRSTFSRISAVNFNVEAMAYECSMPSSFFELFRVKMLLPLACLVYVWVCVAVLRLFDKSKRGHVLYAGANTCVLLLTVLYVAVTQVVLSFVSCTELVNGPHVLDASPDIECYSREHLRWISLFVIGLIVYVLGIPALLYYYIITKRRQLLNKLGSTDELPEWYTSIFGLLSSKYHDYVYWWELIVMVRKALLVIAFTAWSRTLSVKLMMTVIVLFLAVYYQNWYKPMRNFELDTIESVTLVANGIVLTVTQSVLIAQSATMTETSKRFIIVLFYLFVGCCVLVVLWIARFIYKQPKKKRAMTLTELLIKKDDSYVAMN